MAIYNHRQLKIEAVKGAIKEGYPGKLEDIVSGKADYAWFIEGHGDKCYFCGEPFEVGESFVYWQGYNGIALHGNCAKELAENLLIDFGRWSEALMESR